MATSLTDSSSFEDVTACSICFEKFKTPRYLPCSHSFCHDCLSSHIVSVCKSSEPRLGFNCPSCREYIPVVGPFDKPEEWSETFPVNEILEKILGSPNQKLCDSCLRDSEEEDASDFCLSCIEFLCKVCSRCHKKHLLSRSHNVCPLNDIKLQHIQSAFGKEDICKKHPDHKLNLYCFKHEQPCCIICGGTEHRQCDSVEAVEKAEETYRACGKIDSMLEDMRSLRQKLINAKVEQERNITELEDTLDKVTEETEKELNDIIHLIERLKTEHLDEFSAAVKKGKEMLTRNVAIFSDGIQCAEFCFDILEKAKEKQNESTLMIKYYAAKQTFEQLQTVRFRTRGTQIMAKREPILEEIAKMKRIASVEVTELVLDIPNVIFDVSSVQLNPIIEFSIDGGDVRGGTFLSNKTFIFSDVGKGRICYGDLHKKEWKIIRNTEILHNPHDILLKGYEIFVADSKSINVFSVFDYKKLRTLNLDLKTVGISNWKDDFYVACGNKIVKIDNTGNKIKEFNTPGSHTFNVLCTKSGNIVYSDWKINKVSAITDQWEAVWDYSSPNLKCPYGLDSDSQGNIYVSGFHSHNIHVISNSGALIRIFQNLNCPLFLKIAKERNLCCVCSSYKTLTFYEMK
ncbi:E3 ubiquitin-protein ligase Midline-1-like [Saccostrea echinata]|uniref:E3 ubiquitin-protein ligase Midline-1-like n=1 Tax=Saccostrea echinata TaxID=191078 RepID=UPI002A826FF8|nr:E3 ubiquitin-protein ligase Midline-1-like [Saccostrea echinata]